MTEKRFTGNDVYDGVKERFQFYDNHKRINNEDVLNLLNELHEEVERFDMFKTTVAMAIQYRINWLKKQCWDNIDRIDELESLKKELRLE